METLWALHLSRHVRGMVKGPVKSVPAMYAGHLCKATRDLVKPDSDAIASCLPANYRKAWARSGGNFWFTHTESDQNVHGRGAVYITLRNARGRYMNTLYAIPYVKD